MGVLHLNKMIKKEWIIYEQTVNGTVYNLHVKAENYNAFERARLNTCWIRMVDLADKIINITSGTVVKNKMAK